MTTPDQEREPVPQDPPPEAATPPAGAAATGDETAAESAGAGQAGDAAGAAAGEAPGAGAGRRRSGLRDYLEALLIAVIFATFVRTYVVQAFKIPSGSMEENLLVGDHILVNKFIYGPTASEWERRLLPVRDVRRGDVVVFRFPDDPERDFIKRCVGLPGDVVELVDKRLVINGDEVEDDSYVVHRDERVFPRSPFVDELRRSRDNFGPYRVPPDGYFCLGDNRDNSRDSRAWRRTAVPREFVKGRALMIYWSVETPPQRIYVSGRRPPGEGLRALGDRLLALPQRTRWERTFDVVR